LIVEELMIMSEKVGRRIKEVEAISIPELYKVMKPLENDESILPVQSRTVQYLKKFTKLEPEKAEKIKNKLMEIEGIDPEKAAQIINILPKSPEEIKEIFHEKIIVGELASKILAILKEEGVI